MDTFCLLPTIFLHFFDLHFLELKTPGVDPEVLKRECRLATRLSYPVRSGSSGCIAIFKMTAIG